MRAAHGRRAFEIMRFGWLSASGNGAHANSTDPARDPSSKKSFTTVDHDGPTSVLTLPTDPTCRYNPNNNPRKTDECNEDHRKDGQRAWQ